MDVVAVEKAGRAVLVVVVEQDEDGDYDAGGGPHGVLVVLPPLPEDVLCLRGRLLLRPF